MIQSCSLNEAFLNPEYMFEHKREKLALSDSNYAIQISLEPDSQPRFYNKYNTSLELNYNAKSVFFSSKSKNMLHGWMMSPTATYNGITILFCHGNAGNVEANHLSAIPFLKKGFKVFMFDYSGFGLSQGKPTRKNVKKDGESALEFLIQFKDTAREKLIIYGQSLGGHLAPVVACSNKEKVDAVVLEGAFSSHKDISAVGSGTMGRIFTAEKYSGKKALRKLHMPILIIHSKEDERIPFQQALTLFDYANEPKKLITIDQCHLCGIFFYPDLITNAVKDLVQ